MDHAYALLTLKHVDRATRTIRGVAGQPELDRHRDIFRPLGATFRNPIPLLLHHDPKQVIGQVTLDPPTAEGITFTGTLPDIAEDGPLKSRVDGAWQELSAGLIWGCSFGFQPTAAPGILPSGGLDFTATEIIETSLTPIPAQRGATVRVVKSLFGVADMTIAEQITQAEASRQAPVDRMTELVTKSALSAEETAEYDRLDGDVKNFDATIVRLQRVEELQRKSLQPVKPGIVQPFRSATVRPNVEKGAVFTRVAMSMLAGGGDSMRAISRAAQWRDSTPEVELIVKAAVDPATTTGTTWAAPLVPLAAASAEFIDLLTAASVLGKLTGVAKVPFNTNVTLELAGGSANWVGEGKAKPLTSFNYSTTSLPMTKVANIVAFTEELARSSSPNAETVFRRRMVSVISQFLDHQFVDPNVAPVAGVKPGSITNGITAIPATADPEADLTSLLMGFTTANIPLSSITLLMSETNAYALAAQKDVSGNPTFPGMSVTGGTINGIKVIASNTLSSLVIALSEPYIMIADEGGVSIDVSREASLQMSDTPMDPSDASTVYVSLWQNNLIGLRAERFINWARVSDDAVAYLSAAAYTPSAAMAPPAARSGSSSTTKQAPRT